MGKIKENKFLFILILIGIAIFAFVANFALNANKKVTAIVPNGTIEASTIVTDSMLKEIEISVDTPGNFIRNRSSVIGSRVKNTVNENQLLYEGDFMSSWTDFTEAEAVPDDYIVTSIEVPDSQACGGIITAGDYIDVLLVNKEDKNGDNSESMDKELTPADTWLNSTNTNANYVLANVLVLSSDSALAASQESDVSTLQNNGSGSSSSSNDSSTYIIALCYNDYLKLRIADSSEGSEIWLNICPARNKESGPLIEQMVSNKFAYLHDAQDQVMDENGEMLIKDYYEVDRETGTLLDTADEVDNSGLFEADNLVIDDTEGDNSEGSTEVDIETTE